MIGIQDSRTMSPEGQKWAIVCAVFNADQCPSNCPFLRISDADGKQCGLVLSANPRPEQCPQFALYR